MNAMAASFRKAMDALYFVCVLIAGTALVLISAVIPWGVYTRYVLNSAASWPEPTAVLLTIWLTFFGAAACYRLRFHMNVSYLREADAGFLATFLRCACRSGHDCDVRLHDCVGRKARHRDLE